jgi:hypothetical protein
MLYNDLSIDYSKGLTMASKMTLTTRDFSQETSTTSYEGVDLTAGNFAAQNTLMTNLADAQQDIQIGHVFQDARLASVQLIAGVVGSPYAQREMKWLASFEDNVTGLKHSLEIPAPALSFLNGQTDLIDTGGTEYLAYKAAFEAFYRVAGVNAVTLIGMRLVGRNL